VRRRDPSPKVTLRPADRTRPAGPLEASPYRDIKDSPETVYAFDDDAGQTARLISSSPRVSYAIIRFSNTRKPARYARAMAYFKTPDHDQGIGRNRGSLPTNPDNPYSWRCTVRSSVEMGQKSKRRHRALQARRRNPARCSLIRVALARPCWDGKSQIPNEPSNNSRRQSPRIPRTLGWYELAGLWTAGSEGQGRTRDPERYSCRGVSSGNQFAVRPKTVAAGFNGMQRDDILTIARNQQADRRGR